MISRHSERSEESHRQFLTAGVKSSQCELLALYCADVRYKLEYDRELPRRISDRVVADFLKHPKGMNLVNGSLAIVAGQLAILARVPLTTKGDEEAARILKVYERHLSNSG